MATRGGRALAVADDDVGLLPWGVEDDDADAARVAWSQLRPAARRPFAALIEVAPDLMPAPELARRIGVAGALWRPGDLCTSVGRQWAIEWLPPVNNISSYRMRHSPQANQWDEYARSVHDIYAAADAG